MTQNQKRRAFSVKEWIDDHEPDWDGRRSLAGAIVHKRHNEKVTYGQFSVHESDDGFTIEGPQSMVTVKDRAGLDEIMAAIAWVDAIEFDLRDRALI
jgi:hypothetical protein